MDDSGAFDSSATSAALALLHDTLGRRLIKVRRVFYVHKGTVDERAGPLELWFDSLEPLLLTVGSDGETLRLSRGEWTDPFEPATDDVNQAWIAEHGKWSAFTVDRDAQYVSLNGQRVE